MTKELKQIIKLRDLVDKLEIEYTAKFETLENIEFKKLYLNELIEELKIMYDKIIVI